MTRPSEQGFGGFKILRLQFAGQAVFWSLLEEIMPGINKISLRGYGKRRPSWLNPGSLGDLP